MTPTGLLHIGSCLFLGLVVTLTLGILEFDEWKPILKSTLRRWLKFMGALILIGVVVQLLSRL